jgi:hypothetical protein
VSPVVLGPFLACCALLIISGFAKLRDPRATQPAAAAIGVASAVPVVVAFGVVELLIGVAGVVSGGWAAAGVAVMYVVLAGVALRLVRRAPATPCSCLGASNVPATRSHVVLDLAAAVIAVAAARSGGAPLRLVADHPGPALVLGALVGCCVALFGMVLVAGSTEGGGAA